MLRLPVASLRGALGTWQTPVGMIFRDWRAFRLYDGPTEVHKYAIAREVPRSGSGGRAHGQNEATTTPRPEGDPVVRTTTMPLRAPEMVEPDLVTLEVTRTPM